MKSLTYLTIGLILCSCAVQTKTFQKPSADFESYKTWCWMKCDDPIYQGPKEYYNEEVITEIFNSIAWNMHEKGYVQEDTESDLVVNFYISVKEERQEIVEFNYDEYDISDQWLKSEYPEYMEFLRGNLVIDIIDRKTSELIWRSNATRYNDIEPAIDKEMIWAGVRKAMKKLPERSITNSSL